MGTACLSVALCLAPLTWACKTDAEQARALEPQAGQFALWGATIHTSPTGTPIKDGVVLIEGTKIVFVGAATSLELPPTLKTLDCSGLSITAGFWNSHVHFFERKWARAADIPASELEQQLRDMSTRFGFTNVFDTGSAWDNTRVLRERIESGEVLGPGIHSTGEPLLAPNAMPSQRLLGILGFMPLPVHEVVDAEQAARASKQLLERGVHAIKLHLQPPPPPSTPIPENALAAAAAEARRLGKPVFCHPASGEDVLAALRAGVDVIAHTTPRSGAWDEPLLRSLLESSGARQIALTPTLALWQDSMRHDRLSAQALLVASAVEQLRTWLAAGGAVLFGTDSGAAPYDPREEYLLMAKAGMDFPQILASLTSTPAKSFAPARRLGRVAVGFEADLVLLRGDPAKEICALANVEYTIRAGEIVYRAGDQNNDR